MTYAIAAAGTGGHVFPALAVAEALEARGVARDDIVFFGGARFERTAVPAAGYDLVELELRGLRRSFDLANLGLPAVLARAARTVRDELLARDARVLLATGGYVTVPAGWAARRAGIPFFVQEQNAHPGLANRLMSRWAAAAFTSFEGTDGIVRPRFVGNPVRAPFASFDRAALRAKARRRYGLEDGVPTLGVVGGSLGAGVLNDFVAELVREWSGERFQLVHLAGQAHADRIGQLAHSANPRGLTWTVVPFEEDMAGFFAAIDLVVARAGGMVAEITATGTPALLVPGSFGSAGHQDASARHLQAAGAAVVCAEEELADSHGVVADLLFDANRLGDMSSRARAIGRPTAARDIAQELIDAHG